jgi:hypothetical protein
VTIEVGIAHVRRGALVGDEDGSPRLRALAAALPELLATRGGRLDAVDDLLFVSREHVHLAQRDGNDRSRALVAVATRDRPLGLILSEARARWAELARP